MRIAVLGTGLIGRMLVRELARSSMASEVIAVDGSAQAVAAAVDAARAASKGPDQTVRADETAVDGSPRDRDGGSAPGRNAGSPSAHSGGWPQDRGGDSPSAHSGGWPQDRSGDSPSAHSGGWPQDSGGGSPPTHSGGLPRDRAGGSPPDRAGQTPAARTDGARPSVQGVTVDLGSYKAMVELLRGVDIAIAALPDSLSFAANRAAVEAGCHLIDLVGAEYPEKSALDAPAREAGVLVVTGCGLAPGIVNVLAARGIELLDEADEVMIYCGGLPRHPQPPLMYQQVFSMEGLIGLYTRPVFIVEDGQLVRLPPMSGLEDCDFPEPVGPCEAAYSDAHSVPYTLGDKVKRLAEKTVRYRGHFEKMMVLAELGFLKDEPVTVDGRPVSPRAVSLAVLEPQIKGESKEDVTVTRVVATGTKNGSAVRHVWTMVDVFDGQTGYTSMARTTGYPALIVAEWLAQGKLPERGFFAPEQLLVGDRFEPFVDELARRGITMDFSSEEIDENDALSS